MYNDGYVISSQSLLTIIYFHLKAFVISYTSLGAGALFNVSKKMLHS
jgi:hypothetical protein